MSNLFGLPHNAADYESPDLRVKKFLLDYAAGKILMFSTWNGIKKQVLVAGAGGFIGSHMVERLVEMEAMVRALVRNSSPKR